MKGLTSEQIVYALIIGVVVLFNYVMQRIARRQQSDVPQDESLQDGSLEDEQPEEIWGRKLPTQEFLPEPAALVAPVVRTDAEAALPAHPARPFSRQSLLGTRREVQKAFVLATILGDCRAYQPYDAGRSAQSE